MSRADLPVSADMGGVAPCTFPGWRACGVLGRLWLWSRACLVLWPSYLTAHGPFPRPRAPSTEASPPRPRHRGLATKASPPRPRHRGLATEASPPRPRHRGLATEASPHRTPADGECARRRGAWIPAEPENQDRMIHAAHVHVFVNAHKISI